MSFHTFLFDLFSLACLLSLREFFTLLAAARLCSCLKSRAIYVNNFSECLLSWIRNGFACQAKTKSCIFHRKATTYDDCRNVYTRNGNFLSPLVVSSRALVSRFLLRFNGCVRTWSSILKNPQLKRLPQHVQRLHNTRITWYS